MTTLRQTPLTCSGHTRPVVDLAFSDITEHGYFLVSACKDGKPMLRQGDTGDWIGTFEGHKGAVWGATLSKDAKKVATGAADFSAKLFDAVSGEEIKAFEHGHIVKSVSFSNDSRYLLTGSNEKMLRIFDLENIEADPVKFTGHTGGIQRTMFLPGDKKVLSAATDKTIRVWDVETQKELKKITLDASPNDMELSADSTVLTVANGKKVSFYSVSDFELLMEYELPSQVNSASLHPDKSVFVSGGEDFKMYKHDYNTGLEIESFKGHFGPVYVVRFSPDGELYASCSEDGTLRLWQTTVGKTYGLWKYVMPDAIDSLCNGDAKDGSGDNQTGVEETKTDAMKAET